MVGRLKLSATMKIQIVEIYPIFVFMLDSYSEWSVGGETPSDWSLRMMKSPRRYIPNYSSQYT